ncbi:YesK family protein [Halobacillus massiliensis]|uniref:YesK family protein n=1 Tax=Halobacillus massiliensis TaxID=1926286 RepID=UPI0009E3CFDD|nr:YesK family protein [Halobacillus massiliensis]
MMVYAPFLVVLIPGISVLMLTLWFSKKGSSIFLRILPSILLTIAAAILFYIGYVNIRGFEGAAYSLLSFSLIIFASISLAIGMKNKTTVNH